MQKKPRKKEEKIDEKKKQQTVRMGAQCKKKNNIS